MATYANLFAFVILSWVQLFPLISPLFLNHSEVVWEIDNFMSSNTSLTTPPSSSTLNSFPLYNLEIFTKKHHKNYESLVLARLVHDEKRSEQIASSFSVNGNSWYSMSKYRTISTVEEGGYIAIFRIGSETKIMSLLLDTGSTFVLWQCQASCKECLDEIYDASRSSTYMEVDCSSEKCDHDMDYVFDCEYNEDERCWYRLLYGEEEAEYEGILATETITSFDYELVNNITFGCANRKEYFPGFHSGILGFGQGRYSYPTQVGATKFSFCLVSYTSDSVSSVLLHELPVPDDKSTIVIRILENARAPSFYYVGLREIRIADDVIPISPEEWKFDSEGRGGIFIDSSSIVTRFPEDIYSTFRDKFMEEFGGLQHLPGEGAMDTCFHVPSQEWLTHVPSIAFYFDDSKMPLTLNVKQILMPIGRHGKYCLAFGSLSSASWRHSILATWQLQSSALSFDLSTRTLSITPDSCS